MNSEQIVEVLELFAQTMNLDCVFETVDKILQYPSEFETTIKIVSE